MNNHSAGAASPAGARAAVTSTGSGFHEGPALVSRSKPVSSLPQTSHAQAS